MVRTEDDNCILLLDDKNKNSWIFIMNYHFLNTQTIVFSPTVSRIVKNKLDLSAAAAKCLRSIARDSCSGTLHMVNVP